jgi:beta-phosphoglucomutase-like phosphatase (HAD superfamily)
MREAIVVGDSPYDAEAAGKIGLRTIGVLCGGFPERICARPAVSRSIAIPPISLFALTNHDSASKRRPQSHRAPETGAYCRSRSD